MGLVALVGNEFVVGKRNGCRCFIFFVCLVFNSDFLPVCVIIVVIYAIAIM